MAVAVDELTRILYVGMTTGVAAVSPSTGAVLTNSSVLPGGNSPVMVDSEDGLLWVGNGARGLMALHLSNLSTDFTVGIPVGPVLQQGTMTLDPTMNELFVVNETSHAVEVVNATNGQIISPAISAGAGAAAIAFDAADDYVYVAGANLTVIDPSTRLMVGSSIALSPHAIATGVVYDPSRSYLYVTTALGLPDSNGTVTVVDGSSLSASHGSQVIMPVGELPTDPTPILMAGSSGRSASVVWVADLESGTLSVITSPPSITSFLVSPGAVDVGQTSAVLLDYVGGSGAETISYLGLPPGCSSVNATSLNCTPAGPGNFTITATVMDTFGFSANSTVVLSVAPGLSVRTTFTPGPTPILDVDTNLTVVADATGGTPIYSYVWSFGDGSEAIGPNATHVYGSPGAFLLTLSVTDSVHATVSDSTVVQVNLPPTATFTASPTNATDVNIPLMFDAAISGGTAPGTAGWTFGDGTVASGLNASHEWGRSGNYLVTFHYLDAVGDYANQTRNVDILPALAAKFSAGVPGSTNPPVPGTSVKFVANVSGGLSPYNVTWSFGDGSLSFGTSVTHAFALAGSFSIRVSLVDAAGATVTATLPVTVAPSGSSAAQNSGPNDTFNLGIFLGFLGGAALATVIFFAAARTRKRRPPPPNPYVPPAVVATPGWKED